MRSLGVVFESWPDGVVYRCLTAGHATVDVTTDKETGYAQAVCTGTGCGFVSVVDQFQTDSVLGRVAAKNQNLTGAKARANHHAGQCRVMRDPTEVRKAEEAADLPVVTVEIRATALRCVSAIMSDTETPDAVIGSAAPLMAWLGEARTERDLNAREDALIQWHSAWRRGPGDPVSVGLMLDGVREYHAALTGELADTGY